MLNWFNRLIKGQVTIFFVALFGFMLLLTVVLLDISQVAMKKTSLDIITDNAALFLGSSLVSQAKVLSDMNVSGRIYSESEVGGFWSGWLGMVIAIIIIVIAVVVWIITSYISAGSTAIYGGGLVGALIAALIGLAIAATLTFGTWMVTQNLNINNVVRGWAQQISTFANGTTRLRETTLMGILPMLAGDSEDVVDVHDFNRNTNATDTINRFAYYYSERLNQLSIADWSAVNALAFRPTTARDFLIIEDSLNQLKVALLDLRDLITKNSYIYVTPPANRPAPGLWGVLSGLAQPIEAANRAKLLSSIGKAAGFAVNATIMNFTQNDFSYFTDGRVALSFNQTVLPGISEPSLTKLDANDYYNDSNTTQLYLNYIYTPASTQTYNPWGNTVSNSTMNNTRSFLIWNSTGEHAKRQDCKVPCPAACSAACFTKSGCTGNNACLQSCAGCTIPCSSAACDAGSDYPTCATNDAETKLPAGYNATAKEQACLLTNMIWNIMNSQYTRKEKQLADTSCKTPVDQATLNDMSATSLAGQIYDYVKKSPPELKAGTLQVTNSGTYYGPYYQPVLAIKCAHYGINGTCDEPVTTALLQTKGTWIPPLLNIDAQDDYAGLFGPNKTGPEPLSDFIKVPAYPRDDVCGKLLYGENWVRAWIDLLTAFQTVLKADLQTMIAEKKKVDPYVTANPNSPLKAYQADLTLHDVTKLGTTGIQTAGAEVLSFSTAGPQFLTHLPVERGSLNATLTYNDSNDQPRSEPLKESTNTSINYLTSTVNAGHIVNLDYKTGRVSLAFALTGMTNIVVNFASYNYGEKIGTSAIDNINCLLTDVNSLLAPSGNSLYGIYNTIHAQRTALEQALRNIDALTPARSDLNVGEALYVWKDADIAGGNWHMVYAKVASSGIPDPYVKSGQKQNACSTSGYAWLVPYADVSSSHPENGVVQTNTFGPWILAAKYDEGINLAGWQMYSGGSGSQTALNGLKATLSARMAQRALDFGCDQEACKGGMMLMPVDEATGASDAVFTSALNFLKSHGMWAKAHVKVGFVTTVGESSSWQLDLDKTGSDYHEN